MVKRTNAAAAAAADKATAEGTGEEVKPSAESSTSATGVKSTGKEGTDIPPLVLEVPYEDDRFYVAHPDDKLAAQKNLDVALKVGKAFPSITTVCGQTKDLSAWSVQKTAEVAAERFQQLAEASPEERDALIAEWTEKDPWSGKSAIESFLAEVPDTVKEEAAERGTQVHALAEAISHGEDPEVPEELAGYVSAYRAFREEYSDMKYIYTEATVVNRADGSMGTTDAIVRIRGHNYVLDYKTNSHGRVYSTTGMQLAAAANAEEIVYPDGRTEPMPKIHGGIGVGLSPDGKYGVYFFETERNGVNHEGFRALCAAFRWGRAARKYPKPLSRGGHDDDVR
jgi:ATP-dependent exoDNAse (exonuclease V) beta subunit